MSLVYGNVLLFVCVIFELLLISRKEAIPWKEVLTNINSGHVLMWVFRSLTLTVYQWSLQYCSLHLMDGWPYAVQWVLGFLAWDLCFYWSHRFHHKYRSLWAVHVVHHEGEHFSLSLGIRNSWYSSLTSFPFFFGLTVVGLPFEIFVAVAGIHYVVQFYNHNHLVKKSGWLEYIMITPSHHRVHHGKNELYIDKNFGGTFVFWDKLFGTFQPETEPVAFGVHEPLNTHDLVLLNNLPFVKLFRRYEIKEKGIGSSFKTPAYLNVSGTFLLVCLLLCFIYLERSIAGNEKMLLFWIIFLGTIGSGGLSENRLWGILVWTFSAIILNLCFFYFFYPGFFLLEISLCLFLLHGIWLLIRATILRARGNAMCKG